MEVVLLLVVLLLAVLCLSLVLRLRTEVVHARRRAAAAAAQASEARERALQVERGLDAMRHELQQVRDELSGVRALVDSPPPLVLPKSRSEDLEDLREQLRASQQQAAEAEEA
jgi:hypothetical protein